VLPGLSDCNCWKKSIHILNWIVIGEALSSDNSIENADLIGTAVSLKQDDSKTIKSNIAIERYGIFAIMILFLSYSISLFQYIFKVSFF
jgi:hypothetical protein